MSARDNILARLRAAPVIAAPAPATRDCAPRDDQATLITQFSDAMRAAHAEVILTDEEAWPKLLLRLAEEKGVNTLLIGENTPHGQRLTDLHPDNLRLLCYDRPASAWKSELFNEVDAGFTAARSAIADTGSLVLWPDKSEPRLMSLVPPIHFVLLDAATIAPSLSSIMASEHWSRQLPTNVLLISGPSKTADIQQTMAYGAHGPRELIVLVCRTGQGSPA